MRPFFFIPASKLEKIQKVKALGVKDIIIDFEDAILIGDRDKYKKEVTRIPDFQDFWYRIPVRDDFSEKKKDLRLLMGFLEIGVRKIILPKIISKEDFEEVLSTVSSYKEVQLLLLVEHPRLLCEMPQLLQVPEAESLIAGLGFGSQDFTNFLGVAHTSENILFPRQQLLLTAKAYSKVAVDIASMNITKEAAFHQEILTGKKLGYDGKFIIHPAQFEWLEGGHQYEEEQIEWARKIVEALPAPAQGREIEPFVLEGQVIEKPHVEQALKILKQIKNEK